MFEKALLQGGARSQSPWSFAASVSLQTLGAALAILSPLAALPKLPEAVWTAVLLTPAPPAAPAAPPKNIRAAAPQRSRFESDLLAPRNIPEHAALLAEDNEAATAGPSAPAWSTPGGIGFGGSLPFATLSEPSAAVPRPAPAAGPEPKAPVALRIGGRIQETRLIERVQPQYPELARRARISGTVHLDAVISAEGKISRLEARGGHPLLIPAALEAVSQWRYRPTLLNGEPVAVMTQIEVRFVLGS